MVIALPLSGVPGPMQKWVVFAAITIVAPFLFHAFKDYALDRWIGDLSYPLYLCHLVVIGLVLTFEPPFAVWVAIGGALTLSAALLILVDHPVDRWRQRRVASTS
jgi:peptidoglycan/LPS O-acetylase OafA/YrhL